MARRSRRFGWLLLLASAAATAWFAFATRDPWPAEQGIAVAPGEEEVTARAIAAAIARIDAARSEGRPFARESFARAHGCARATLAVPQLEPRLRHGLFAQAGEYRSWVRFSNGDARSQSDQLRDARGFALKVTGVAGHKLLASEADADSQDFLLSDSPRFFVADVRDYVRLADAAAAGDVSSFYFEGGWLRPWRWRLRELYLAERSRRSPPASVLQTQYYSQTPYRLGPQQLVKYSARPCVAARPPRQDRTEHMLRQGLKEELTIGDACFELLVQLQVPGRNTPVENPTVAWSEGDSPFLTVARVLIPRQAIDAPGQDELCEALSFTPWHALVEHEPVGGINRLRRAVYQEVSRYRHARNGTPRREPRGWCLDPAGASCPAEAASSVAPGAGPTPPSPSSPRPAASATPRPRPKPTATPTPEEPVLEPPPPEEPPPSDPPPPDGAAAPPPA